MKDFYPSGFTLHDGPKIKHNRTDNVLSGNTLKPLNAIKRRRFSQKIGPLQRKITDFITFYMMLQATSWSRYGSDERERESGENIPTLSSSQLTDNVNM